MKTLFALTLLLLSAVCTNVASAQNNTYALIIGVSRYKNPGIKHLKYADKDALSFEKMLLSKAGGGLSRDNVKCLVNDSAHYSRCMSSIQWLYRTAKSGDRVIFYFSGHGDALNSEHVFLLPYDAPVGDPILYDGTAIHLPHLKSYYFKLMLAKGVNVTLITDACRTNEVATENNFGVTFSDAMKINNGEIVLNSCQPNQRSEEDERWGHGHGVFTWYLMQGWMGLADENESGEVTVGELFDYVKDKVKKETFDFEKKATRQVPSTCCENYEDQVISKVDPETVKRLKEIEDGLKDTVDLVAYATKKGGDYYDEDTATMRVYNQLVAAVTEDQILYPENDCAYFYYNKLKKMAKGKPIFFDGESELISALNAKGQDLLNSYLNGTNDHISMSQLKEAFEYMEKGLQILPKDDPYYKNFKVKSLFLESQYLMHDISSRNIALAKVDSAISMQPGAVYLYYSKGLIYEKFLNYDSAITYYNKTIEMAPKWTSPYYQKAWILYSVGNRVEAINVMYNLETKNNKGTALVTIGQFFNKLDSSKIAIKYFNLALQKDSMLIDAYLGMYSACRNLLQDSIGSIYYYKAYGMDPENRTINIMDANYDAAIGDYGKAERKYRKIYEADSSDLYYLLKMAEVKYKSGETDEATAMFARIIERDHLYVYTYYSLISIFEDAGKFEDAIYYNKYLMGIEPGYNPAKLYYPMRQLGMLDSAQYYLDLGFKKFPNDQYTIELKAWALMQDKKYEEAIPIYEDLVAKNTYSSSIFTNMATCYYYMNQRDKCLKYGYLTIKFDPYDVSNYSNMFTYMYNFSCSNDSMVNILITPIRDFGVNDENYLITVANNLARLEPAQWSVTIGNKGMELYPDNYRFYMYLAIYCARTQNKYLYDYLEAAYKRGMPCEAFKIYEYSMPDPKKDGKYRKISRKICNF